MTREEAEHVLRDVRECAAGWAPTVRLVGNVRAGDIVEAIAARDEEVRCLRAALDLAVEALPQCEYERGGVAYRIIALRDGDSERVHDMVPR